MQEIVTVIVPVYNAEKYIRKCVKSILEQNYTNLELLLIDDASTDKTWECIENLQKSDERIKAFQQATNKGPGAARNLGLYHANGKWIFFVDSDDAIATNMINTMVAIAEKNSADLAICDFYAKANKKGEIFGTKMLTREEYVKKYYYCFPPNTYVGSNCNKCYKAEIIKRQNIRFDENERFAEDYRFNVNYMHHVEKLCVLSQGLYVYNRHNNSLSTKAVSFDTALKRYEELFIYGWRAFESEMSSIERKKYKDGYLIAVSNALYDAVEFNLPVKEVCESVCKVFASRKRCTMIRNASFNHRYPYCIVWLLMRLKKYKLLIFLFYCARRMRTFCGSCDMPN